MIKHVQQLRVEYGRDRDPFEIHAVSIDAYSPDGVRRLEDAGVTDVIVGFRWPYTHRARHPAARREDRSAAPVRRADDCMIRMRRGGECPVVKGRRLIRCSALAVVLLIAAACSSSAKSGTSASTTTSTTRAHYRPLYVKGPCNDEVPHNQRIECGTLTVPENRSKPDGRKVVLPVAILRTADPHPAPDPVVYFQGGPGFAGLPAIAGFLDHGYTGNRDVIVFDQRGTGEAKPSLACPEVYDANAANNADYRASYDVARKRFSDAVHTCAERLAPRAST